jgi:DNA-binding LacI/PurR family transcriptional regulator
MSDEWKERSMAATMRDVAALANVSQRTVSNVVNDYVHVKPETRERVQRAIDLLKYKPSPSARILRGGKTGLVALAVPEINAPYFAELADLVQTRASARGLTLLIDQTGGTRERELLVLDGYHRKAIDGLILSPLAITADDLERRELDIPTVLLGESVTATNILHVSIDNVAAARAAVQYLLASGRRRVAAIGAVLNFETVSPAQRRTEGYLKEMHSAGHAEASSLAFPTSEWSLAEGYRVAQDVVRREPDVDALFCFNDTLAIGAIKALTDLGIAIPGDVAVLGWDDIAEASYSNPSLTTITPDKAGIAHAAVDSLLHRLDGQEQDQTEITTAFTLTVRDST